MGQFFGNLTNPGVQSPGGGAQFFDPSQVQSGAYAKTLTPQPGSLQPQGTLNPQGNAPPMPQSARPSFLQAASMGAQPGEANALSPGLSKAGKLAVLLTQGLKGGLAGEASAAQAVMQSGGRRGGNVGSGFQAGYTEPLQEQAQRNQLAQQQAQTTLTRAQADMIPTPYGMMPAALARYILPASIREQGTLGAAQIGAGSRVQAAQIGQRFKAVPNVGLFDTQSGQVIPGTGQGITVTPEIAKDYGLPQDFIGKPMSLSNFSSLENAQRFNEQPVEGANGPALVNRNPASPNFGQVLPLNLGNPSMGRPLQVADPDNPGNTKFVPAGQAVKTGAAGPQSASVQVPRTVLKSATSGPIGSQINAFNTALQHADLLQQALTALNNGDVRTINSLKNSFKTEFGSADVSNFRTIANAYTREITKMLAAGHMTDAEIGSAGATIPANASPQQILGALQAYRTLATSKMQQLQGQVNAGMQGKPNFPANLGQQKQNDPLGIR